MRNWSRFEALATLLVSSKALLIRIIVGILLDAEAAYGFTELFGFSRESATKDMQISTAGHINTWR